MNNDRKIFEEISEFLAQGNKPAAIAESVKPFAESRLHLLETAEIRAELNAARAGQYLLKQFSAAEIAHNAFVDEAVAVLNYRTLTEGVVPFPKKAAGKFSAGDRVSVEFYQGGSKKSRGTAKIDRVSDAYAWAKVDGETVQVLQSTGQEPVAPKADYFKFVKESAEVQEAKDWDEGNSEPGNNFAIFINGKKWKVLPGPRGTKADSPAERKEFDRLRTMAQNKTATTGKKWEVRITGEKITESEELDELSTALLGKYKSAAGKAASAADAAGDYKTGNKRFSGIMKATKKQFANDTKELKKESEDLDEAAYDSTIKTSLKDRTPRQQAAINAYKKTKPKQTKMVVHLNHEDGTVSKQVFKMKTGDEDEAKKLAAGHLKNMQYIHDQFPKTAGPRAIDVKKYEIKESEETNEAQLDELSAKTLGSYVKKATVAVAQNSYNSGRKVHEPKEYHKSKQAAKSRIQGVMRAANKLSAPRNESAEPADRALWAELTEQARAQFESYPSIASAGWIAREYSAQGGEWITEDAE